MLDLAKPFLLIHLMYHYNYSSISPFNLILSRFLHPSGKNSAKTKDFNIFTTDLHPWLQIFHPAGVRPEYLRII
jgi:hypothetical protein